MELIQIRKELDSLNNELVQVLAKRMALIPAVANFKKENQIKRFQPEREQEILSQMKKKAEEKGLNPDLVEDIFKKIIKDAHRIEKGIMGE